MENYTVHTRNQILLATRDLIKTLINCVRRGGALHVNPSLLNELLVAGLNAPGFSERQRWQLVQAAEFAGRDVKLSPLLKWWPWEVLGRKQDSDEDVVEVRAIFFITTMYRHLLLACFIEPPRPPPKATLQKGSTTPKCFACNPVTTSTATNLTFQICCFHLSILRAVANVRFALSQYYAHLLNSHPTTVNTASESNPGINNPFGTLAVITPVDMKIITMEEMGRAEWEQFDTLIGDVLKMTEVEDE